MTAMNGVHNSDIHRKRQYTLMSQEEADAGKKSTWLSLELTGNLRNISPDLFRFTFLTQLYLNNNQISYVSAEISKLQNLQTLDLSHNRLRQIPAQLGDLVNLRELLLNNNHLRSLPFELGRLIQLLQINVAQNPLPQDILSVYNENGGVNKLLIYLLDQLRGSAVSSTYQAWVWCGITAVTVIIVLTLSMVWAANMRAST